MVLADRETDAVLTVCSPSPFAVSSAVAAEICKVSRETGRSVFTYSGALSGIPNTDSPSTLARSYTITAEVEVPKDGGDGMIVTAGGPADRTAVVGAGLVAG